MAERRRGDLELAGVLECAVDGDCRAKQLDGSPIMASVSASVKSRARPMNRRTKATSPVASLLVPEEREIQLPPPELPRARRSPSRASARTPGGGPRCPRGVARSPPASTCSRPRCSARRPRPAPRGRQRVRRVRHPRTRRSRRPTGRDRSASSRCRARPNPQGSPVAACGAHRRSEARAPSPGQSRGQGREPP